MRILITGVAGFIGSTLADALVEDHEVCGVDNFQTGVRENLSASFDLTVGGIEEDLPWGDREADLIIHCAAAYKDPREWERDVHTNILGAQMVAEKAQLWNAHIIYFQTVLPPISSYAISKIAGEHYLRLSGQPLTVFRLAAVYGPRNLSGAIPTFYRQVKAGLPCTVVEDASRDFVFVDDLVKVVEAAVTGLEYGTFDIRTGIETRILDIPGMIGQLLETEAVMKLIPRPPHDVPHYDMDGPAMLSIPFTHGLKKAVEWYEEHGVTDTYTHLEIKDAS